MIPTSVRIDGSENGCLGASGKVIDYAAFESLLRTAILLFPRNQTGYDKCWITVMFDNGHTYSCRLDINHEFPSTFRELVQQRIQFGRRTNAKYWQKELALLESIQWDPTEEKAPVKGLRDTSLPVA